MPQTEQRDACYASQRLTRGHHTFSKTLLRGIRLLSLLF